MNVEQLLRLLETVNADVADNDAPLVLRTLRDALSNLGSQPADSSFQQRVAEQLDQLDAVTEESAVNSFTPTWTDALARIGGAEKIGRALFDRVERVVQTNTLTPAVAAQTVSQISTEVDAWYDALRSGQASLVEFGFVAETAGPGEGQVAVSIPREEVSEELAELGKEFRSLTRIVNPFNELVTGSRPPVEVKALSSSDYTVIIPLIPAVLYAFAQAVDKCLDVYERVRGMMAHNDGLAEQGLDPALVEAITAAVRARVEGDVDAIVAELLEEYARPTSDGRDHELGNDLRVAVRDLASRVDHNYQFDVQVTPSESDDGEQVKTAQAIERIAPRLQRLPHHRPVLEIVRGGADVDEPEAESGTTRWCAR
ncbi:MAG: hypothetical protein U0R68_12200 [Candidatus Nanopelagicales bacterium]